VALRRISHDGRLTKEARTREEWEAAWAVIKPIFADVLVSEIDFPACDEFYTGLEERYSLDKKHRVFKIFRALLEVAIGFKLIKTNPTHKIANTAPKGAIRDLVGAGDRSAPRQGLGARLSRSRRRNRHCP
jgi:hypothetical protein